MRKSIIEFLNNTKKPALFKAKSRIDDDFIQSIESIDFLFL